MKLPRLTSRLIIAVLTFVIGIGAALFWIAHRLPTVDHLEEPNCVDVASNEQSIVKCTQSKAVGFCELVKNPERYNHKIVRVGAIIVGYHHQHLYDPACYTENTNTWADYESPQTTDKMMKAIAALKDEGFERGNIWANVVLVGRFEERQLGDPPSDAEDPNFPQIHPIRDRFRFVIMNV